MPFSHCCTTVLTAVTLPAIPGDDCRFSDISAEYRRLRQPGFAKKPRYSNNLVAGQNRTALRAELDAQLSSPQVNLDIA